MGTTNTTPARDTARNKAIAEEILAQLGGRRFVAMTGSKNFSYGADGTLNMSLTRNKSGATHLSISLNSMDTYDMHFVSCRGASIKEKASFEGVYCDMLQEIFTQATGLYTSL